jgi:hypothetical protein
MKICIYTEGPWLAIAKADETDTDWIEVSDEKGQRWLDAQDNWDIFNSEIRKEL